MKDKKFLAALCLAAIYGTERGFINYVKATWHVLVALVSRRGKAPADVYEARMKCCESCPIYASNLSTCGSPLSDNPELGCFCYLPVRNAEPSATCWMDDEFGDEATHGWKSSGVS